jgi:hypothetical protein
VTPHIFQKIKDAKFAKIKPLGFAKHVRNGIKPKIDLFI